MKLKGKTITVVGLGRSGFAAAKFLLGHSACVRVTDHSQRQSILEDAQYLRTLGAEVETGAHHGNFVNGSDLVVTSPGVSRDSAPLVQARSGGIPVISEVELAGAFCPGRIVAVTGSNGKTTTCHLIHRILNRAGVKNVLCGNVGYAFLSAISEMDSRAVAVVELSSFQLEDSPGFRPHIAVVLNVSPNHLDRHGSMENYARAKEGIFKNQRRTDWLLLNADDKRVCGMAARSPSRVLFFGRHGLERGVTAEDGAVLIRSGRRTALRFSSQGFQIQGEHNLENILAAVGAAHLVGAPASAMQKALEEFQTLEHRLEPLGRIRGITFVNDAKSTTVESTRAALLAQASPVILVAGGRDKGAPFEDLEELMLERVKRAVLYGEARERIAQSWARFTRYEKTVDLKTALERAVAAASEGDTVLFSPMCTSFDQFRSYEERGETFKRLVRELRLSEDSSRERGV